MKKTILTFAALLVAGMAANAQTGKGKMWIGGMVGFGSTGGSTTVSGSPIPSQNGTTKMAGTTNINLAPNFMYFFQDNMAAGISVNYGSTSTAPKAYYDENTGMTSAVSMPGLLEYENKTSNSGLGVGLFVNKYNELNDKWMWYYGGNLGFNNGTSTTTSIQETAPGSGKYAPTSVPGPKMTTIGLGANMGVLFFLTEKWKFSAGLNNLLSFNYNMGKTETTIGPMTTVTKNNSMNLGLGTGSFGIGALTFGVSYVLN
ncbi:MAG: outer membrane beta-barrel protein [Bacteroidetes bacterium]|nr:outer membrane beta-barrel protein [Bacteroidota bacterium]